MQRFHLVAMLKPVPWSAPYVGDRGAFTAEKLKRYQADLAILARQAMNGRAPFDGLLRFDARFFFPRPKSKPVDYVWRWGKDETDIWKHTRPDCANLLKAAEDALENVVYFDDKQIVDDRARKYFCDHGDQPRVEIVVEETLYLYVGRGSHA